MIVRHVRASSRADGDRLYGDASFEALVRKQIEEHGIPDHLYYSSCDGYYDGHFTRYSALMIWEGKTDEKTKVKT